MHTKNPPSITYVKAKVYYKLYLAILLLFCQGTTAVAADLAQYKKMAENTIEQAASGHISDIDALIVQQEMMIKIGINACNEYASKNPSAKRTMDLVTSNVESMKKLSLHEIEEKWHEGGEFKKNGITIDDHFSELGSLIDAVIHPATSYIALNHFKKNKNKNHLQQVVAELTEVLAHIAQVK